MPVTILQENTVEVSPPVRVIAFYLPQFHPIPENDECWGRGFTEWTNATRATPQFPGHDQPHLPADLGFYDLRLPEARAAQADLARGYGIHGFCYYHYWFDGKRLLERPFNEVLASGEPDFPFCLCWANEPWSRRWDGSEHEIICAQRYSREEDLRHIRWLAEAFRDPRYIRVEGKPLFLVYRATHLPDSRATTRLWRDECDRLGIGPVFLATVQAFSEERNFSPEELGFDATVEFAPQWDRVGPRLHFHGRRNRILRRLRLLSPGYHRHRVHSYRELARLAMEKPLPSYELFRCVTPMWDNSPRRAQGAYIFHGSTPELYENWLHFVLGQTMSKPQSRRLAFVNAWNEWAEGNHLEPCQRWGIGYLEATRRALSVCHAR
jgi:lipopolysaccharide biosynthesis protein